MDLVYFGSGAFGLPTLEALTKAHRVRAVMTQPDRPAGRGKKLTPTPIAIWAQSSGLELLKAENVNAPEVTGRIHSVPADAWVVIAFGQKLSRRLLEGVFAINLHASLLPRWRGAAPINAAILAGDVETGNSVITLAERMDAGLVLGQSRRAIKPEYTAGDLHDLLSADGPALVLDVLAAKSACALQPQVQDEAMVTIAPKLSNEDRWVDFSQPAASCMRRIHGLTPWPGTVVEVGADRLKASRVQVDDAGGESEEAGILVDASRGVVTCGGGTALRFLEVQPPGKWVMRWEEYARGRSLLDGQRVHGGTGA